MGCKEYIFDNTSKKIYINRFSVLHSLNECEKFEQNEIIIDLISNLAEIKKELILILQKLEKDKKKFINGEYIYIDIRNIIKISFIFNDLERNANYYAKKNYEQLIELIKSHRNLINNIQLNNNEYKESIKLSRMNEDDEFDFILYIGNKYNNNFPPKIKTIYENLEKEYIDDVEYVSEKDWNTYENYIKNNYNDEYKQVTEENISSYRKEMKKNEEKIIKYKNYIKKYNKKKKNEYYNSFYIYISKIYYKLVLIEYQIKAINKIDNNIVGATPEQEYFLKHIIIPKNSENELPLSLYSPNIQLPSLEIIYAIKNNDKLIELDDYKIESWRNGIEDEKIIFDFLSQEVIELHCYKCKDILDILNVLFFQYKISNVSINKCCNCGKYFIPKIKSNEKYCNRISPQDNNKTCKQYGMRQTYKDNVSSSIVRSEHNRTSQFYRMRISRTQNIKQKEKYKKAFEKYKNDYKSKYEKYNQKKLSESEFANWIIEQKNNI